MRELLSYTPEVPVEALEAAARSPLVFNFAPCVGEHRAEMRVDRDVVTEFFLQLIKTALSRIGPNAQYVRIIGNAYGRHAAVLYRSANIRMAVRPRNRANARRKTTALIQWASLTPSGTERSVAGTINVKPIRLT